AMPAGQASTSRLFASCRAASSRARTIRYRSGSVNEEQKTWIEVISADQTSWTEWSSHSEPVGDSAVALNSGSILTNIPKDSCRDQCPVPKQLSQTRCDLD